MLSVGSWDGILRVSRRSEMRLPLSYQVGIRRLTHTYREVSNLTATMSGVKAHVRVCPWVCVFVPPLPCLCSWRLSRSHRYVCLNNLFFTNKEKSYYIYHIVYDLIKFYHLRVCLFVCPFISSCIVLNYGVFLVYLWYSRPCVGLLVSRSDAR